VHMAGEAIDWLDANEHHYDVWMLVAYAATSCALVQYHTWARRKDTNAQEKLRKLRDCVRRWEANLQPEHMSSKRKTAEIITLLYETTQGPPINLDDPPALNPTGGVTRKIPASFKGLKYKQDPSRPGGGVFVAHGKAKELDYTDMLDGTVIINAGGSDEESEAGAQAASAAAEGGAGSPPAGTSPVSAAIVSYTPLGGSGGGGGGNFANVNPSLNDPAMQAAADVQVMNVLDVPHAPNTLEQFANVDRGLLEGLPGTLFDWPQWEHFFSRFSGNQSDPNAFAAYAQAHVQAQADQAVPRNGEQAYPNNNGN